MLSSDQYMDALVTKVQNSNDLYVKSVTDFSDAVVRNKHNNKEIYVQLKDGGSYGELPLATALQLNKAKEKHPDILLVSFSKISTVLAGVLDNLNIKYLIMPTPEDAVAELSRITAE